MPVRSSRIPSRTMTLLGVAIAHALVLWIFWRVPLPVVEEAETFASVLLLQPATPRSATNPTPAVAGGTPRTRPAALPPVPKSALAPGQADTATATTSPATVPTGGVDWSAQLSGAADSALNREKRERDQAAALTRKIVTPADPLNPGHGPGSGFRWYDAGIHRIDSRGPLPVLHLNDRCLLLAFILPVCAIGHIEIHGDMFQNMVTTLDEREATARPNDVP